jgi:phosphatidate cytidylyltransferase
LKPGLYFVAKERPDLDLVPVYLQNLCRILPKDEILPVPLLGSSTFGPPLRLTPGEGRRAFLDRARSALIALGGTAVNVVWDQEIVALLAGILGLLVLASAIGWVLGQRVQAEAGQAVVANLNARVRAWWVMTAVFAAALATGGLGSVILFGLTSFIALREFITLTPTRRADHRTLFWAFFVFVPVQYWLVATQWYGLFVIFIPVYAFLFVPVRSVLAGDTEDFLARTAKIQWGLMVAVYCVSHAPALLMLDIPGYAGENAKLLLYLIVVVQLSDVLQYVFGKTLGRHKIVPG